MGMFANNLMKVDRNDIEVVLLVRHKECVVGVVQRFSKEEKGDEKSVSIGDKLDFYFLTLNKRLLGSDL